MKDKLFIYVNSMTKMHQSFQTTVGRATGLFLERETITFTDFRGEQHSLSKLIGLAGEQRMKHLYVYQAEILSPNLHQAERLIKHFRDYGVEMYFGTDIIPKGDERFEHIINQKYY